jgi:hypothetical protein
LTHHHTASVTETITKRESQSGDELNSVLQQPQPTTIFLFGIVNQ